jgi:hypothetical protein
MTLDGAFAGYLYVHQNSPIQSEEAPGHLEYFYYMSVLLWTGKPELRRYGTDRLDPEDYDALPELLIGRIEWYGNDYAVEWIAGPEADVIYHEYFEPPPERPKRARRWFFMR